MIEGDKIDHSSVSINYKTGYGCTSNLRYTSSGTEPLILAFKELFAIVEKIDHGVIDIETAKYMEKKSETLREAVVEGYNECMDNFYNTGKCQKGMEEK